MSWSQILGHADRIESFRQIVARGRLAHAYLFVGPPGIGKRRFAQEIAKALLCERRPSPSASEWQDGPNVPIAGAQAPTFDACDRCDACLLLDAGTHPDLFAISPPADANIFEIELIRDFREHFMLKPARGRGKIAILDQTDLFQDPAANCFLKTLEEPPPRALLILLSDSLDRQYETIKSRCQMVRFAPLSDAHVRTLLQKQGITDAAMLDRLVRLSGGSPGQALALADESLWQKRRELLQAFVKPKIDTFNLGKDVVDFVEKAGKETAHQRRRANQLLRLLIESFTDALRVQSGAPARSAESAELPLLESLAQRASPDKIQAILERCLETEMHLGRYVQLSLVLEGLLDALGQLLEQTGALPLRFQGFSS